MVKSNGIHWIQCWSPLVSNGCQWPFQLRAYYWNGRGDRINATVVGFRCFKPNHSSPILQQSHRPSNSSQQCQAALASTSPVSNIFVTLFLSLTSLSLCRKMYRRHWWKQGIGYALSRAVAQTGANVAIIYRSVARIYSTNFLWSFRGSKVFQGRP